MSPFRPPALPLHHPATLLATWGGVGLLRLAPGTWGSLAALPVAWLILFYADWRLLLVASVLVFAAGCWAAGRYERAGSGHDPGAVVVDEVAGQWVSLLPAALDPLSFALGFVLFRLFDVLKPWPVGWLDDRVKGGLGIMLDDLAAAAYVLPLMLLWRAWWTGF